MMNSVNQVAYEAAEPSSEQVTQDSYQDESLSLMRYKELQFIAMSLNLPGNLKHKMLVEVIRARRANREGEVDRILAEHRGNRKAIAKRMAASKEEEDSCEGGSDGRSKGHHRKRLKTQSPPRTTQSPPAAPDPYIARLYGAYAYPMQPKPATPMNRSILANYLSSAGPSSSVKNDWRYSSSNVYSSAPVQESSSVPYPQADRDSYNQIMSCNLASTTVAAADSSGTTQRFIQGEKGCASLQQQTQFGGHNYGNNYSNKQTLACANQSTLSYSNYAQSSFISPQLSTSQSSSDSSYSSYQYASDPSQESNRHAYVKKNYPHQAYGQQYLSNERFESREQSQSNVETLHSSVTSNYQSTMNSGSTSWNDSSLGNAALSQQTYRKYPMYSNINMWQYQGVHVNFNELEENSPNVAHDLTVTSRRSSQEVGTNSVMQITNQCHSSSSQGSVAEVNQTTQSPARTQPHPYVEGRMDSLNHSNKQVNAADQFVDHQAQRGFADRMTLNSYQQIQGEDHSLAHAAASYFKDKIEDINETPDAESCPEDSFNTAYTSTNDTTTTYNYGVNIGSLLNQTSQYSCQDITPSASFSGSTSSSSQVPSCTTCDMARYSMCQTQYQNLSQNNIQPHITHNNQYSMHHGVNYAYNQSEQAISYVTRQNHPYSQLSSSVYNFEANPTLSPDQAVNRYFPEQAGDDVQNSYTTQNSIESMWSAVRVPSPDLDRSLLTPSPKENGMSIVPDVCDSTSVFPDEADLEIGEDQALSFPNIYDYVMSAADDGSVDPGLELHGSKGSSETGDSPSPEALQVVEAEEIVISKSPSVTETPVVDEVELVKKGEKCGKGELNSKAVGESLVNFSETSSDVVELVNEESEKSKEGSDKLKKKVYKRKTRLNKEGSPLIQFYRSRRLRDHSPSRKVRSKVGVHRDQMLCPQGKKGCKWMGRIHGLASHVRSEHRDSIIVGSDSSYIISLKDLKTSNQVMFFQEAAGILYLIAVHHKDSLLCITIQSLPGSGRSGAPPTGTKASLEVLLKNGKSQGWRGRIWGLVAPSVLYTQRPLNSSFLQERLWSRGDCLSVDPSKVCDSDSKKFRLYVSITPPKASTNSSQVIEPKEDRSLQISPLQSNPLTQVSPPKVIESIPEKETDCEETCSLPSNGNVESSVPSPKNLDDDSDKSPVLSSTPINDCSEN